MLCRLILSFAVILYRQCLTTHSVFNVDYLLLTGEDKSVLQRLCTNGFSTRDTESMTLPLPQCTCKTDIPTQLFFAV